MQRPDPAVRRPARSRPLASGDWLRELSTPTSRAGMRDEPDCTLRTSLAAAGEDRSRSRPHRREAPTGAVAFGARATWFRSSRSFPFALAADWLVSTWNQISGIPPVAADRGAGEVAADWLLPCRVARDGVVSSPAAVGERDVPGRRAPRPCCAASVGRRNATASGRAARPRGGVAGRTSRRCALRYLGFAPRRNAWRGCARRCVPTTGARARTCEGRRSPVRRRKT